MQPGEKKKLVVLVALVSVIGLIWAYRLIFGGGPAPAGPAREAAVRPAAPPPNALVAVELDKLDKERPGYEAGRNIFNPAYVEPVIKPPSTGAGAGAGAPGAGPVTPPPPPPPPPDIDGDGVPDVSDKCQDTPPGVAVDSFGCRPEETAARNATEELKKFKFIGFLKRGGRTNVFLSFNTSYYTAAKGEDIYKSYYLKDIGNNYLLFADRDTTAELRLNVNFEEAGKSGNVVPSPGASGGAATPQPPRPVQRPMAPTPRQQYGRPGAAGGFPQAQQGEEDDEDVEDDEEDEGDDDSFGAGGAGATGGAAVPQPGSTTPAAPPPLKARSTW